MYLDIQFIVQYILIWLYKGYNRDGHESLTGILIPILMGFRIFKRHTCTRASMFPRVTHTHGSPTHGWQVHSWVCRDASDSGVTHEYLHRLYTIRVGTTSYRTYRLGHDTSSTTVVLANRYSMDAEVGKWRIQCRTANAATVLNAWMKFPGLVPESDILQVLKDKSSCSKPSDNVIELE